MTSGPELLGPFREALRELGYIEGTRPSSSRCASARSNFDRLPGMAADLVARKVDVIVASANSGRYRRKKRDTQHPDRSWERRRSDLRHGFVTSLARPGGQCDGPFCYIGGACGQEFSNFSAKLFRMARRVGVVGNPDHSIAETDFLEQIQAAEATRDHVLASSR